MHSPTLRFSFPNSVVNERYGDLSPTIILVVENPTKPDGLPSDVLEGAVLVGSEYGWSPESFPAALRKAETHGFACLGGQFQFRVDNGSICEMYWLNADSKERLPGESWTDYCRRSCFEVRENFDRIMSKTDFSKEASGWNLSPTTIRNLVFVAYFITENELAKLESQADLIRRSPHRSGGFSQ